MRLPGTVSDALGVTDLYSRYANDAEDFRKKGMHNITISW